MKKKLRTLLPIIVACALCLALAGLTGCGGSSGSDSNSNKEQASSEQITINQSPDKYTWYVKNYVGMNLANVGYISMAGDLRDTYGKGNIKLSPVADDGSFIDTDDIESLKQYRVGSQSIEPNTELSFTFDPEYDNIVRSQSVQTIELKVTKVA